MPEQDAIAPKPVAPKTIDRALFAAAHTALEAAKEAVAAVVASAPTDGKRREMARVTGLLRDVVMALDEHNPGPEWVEAVKPEVEPEHKARETGAAQKDSSHAGEHRFVEAAPDAASPTDAEAAAAAPKPGILGRIFGG